MYVCIIERSKTIDLCWLGDGGLTLAERIFPAWSETKTVSRYGAKRKESKGIIEFYGERAQIFGIEFRSYYDNIQPKFNNG